MQRPKDDSVWASANDYTCYPQTVILFESHLQNDGSITTLILKQSKIKYHQTFSLIFHVQLRPEQYFIAMSGHQSYAPFGSVSLRSKKNKRNEEKPGPGSYEVSLPFIMPIVQTIRKKNNNVIVKLGHMGTASFQSDQNRFKERSETMIGPGQYSPEKGHDRLKQSRPRNIAREKVESIIKHLPERRAAISEVREIEINDYVEMPSAAKKKQEVKRMADKIKGAIWSKMTEGRQLKVRSVSNMGPGDYDPKYLNNKAVPSAAFKSQSIRSFFDNIYFQTNQDKLAMQREEKKYKGEGVGPGKYNINEENNKFYKFQFFGSTEERRLL